ncbi:phospholipase B1, membrane-associated isoform X2 [Electrophorus electricus]|uniref:phospholipase B1, membrane-associated isoform X2 n=1 Tax=Electrophorus electricus TaxID=8005 RepID=UPI0015CFAF81|nr:phospholipase B1, membrane-associated isoform X2 [Electrophorus electricus]
MATCLLASCPVKGDEWRWEYEEGLSYYSEEALRKVYPEKTRPVSFKHPPFWCSDMSPSSSIPTSVELVKAADIKVIAALGDSLTTAIGANATTVLGIPIEFRHVSWSIGGHGTFQDVITLANLLRLFNPSVVGPAPCKTVHGTPAPVNETGFNLAITGHNTFNLPEQTRHLIDTLKINEDVNFDEDWKLLTILIGMNDICDYCKDKTLFSVENFIHYMSMSLEMLMNEVPRMIVNVVQILAMEGLREVQKPTLGCLLQRSFCSCLVKPASGSADLKELIEVNLQFQSALEQLLNTDRFFKSDFAVVLQPFLKHTDPPRLSNGKIDLSFFTPDCFHFTMKGHEELAKGLWNNMFQPEGEKCIVESFSNPIQLICPPVDHPYIYTKPKAVKAGSQPGMPVSTGLHTTMFTLAFVLLWWATNMTYF